MTVAPAAPRPEHPNFFGVTELVARGWGAATSSRVSPGDLGTPAAVKSLFASLLTASIAENDAKRLKGRAKLLWQVLDLAFATTPKEPDEVRGRRRAGELADAALASLKGVNVKVEGEAGGLCWLQLLHRHLNNLYHQNLLQLL